MISVCLAAYEDDVYLEDQIVSILDQLNSDDEIIISDDSLTKRVYEVCRKINDNKIKYIKGPREGVIKNFENALKNSSGEIIFLSDQDDIWLKDKVYDCVNSLKKYDLVLTNAIVVDENLDIIDELLFKKDLKYLNIFSTICKNKFIGCCMAFNRKILDESLPFPVNIPMHDWWIGLIGLSKGKVFYNHQPYIKYRRHQHVLTNTQGKSRFKIITRILFRLKLIKSLLLTIFKYMKSN